MIGEGPSAPLRSCQIVDKGGKTSRVLVPSGDPYYRMTLTLEQLNSLDINSPSQRISWRLSVISQQVFFLFNKPHGGPKVEVSSDGESSAGITSLDDPRVAVHGGPHRREQRKSSKSGSGNHN